MGRNTGQLSGKTYVSARLRLGSESGRAGMVRIPIQNHTEMPLRPTPCDHTFTVCATWDCIESWTCDYQFNLWRTEGGRVLARKLRLDPRVDLMHADDMRLLWHEDFVIPDPL